MIRVWLAALLAVPTVAAPAPLSAHGVEVRAAREERFVQPTAHRTVDIAWREASARRSPHAGTGPFLPGFAPAPAARAASAHRAAPAGRTLPVPRSAHHPPYYATAPPASLR